MNKLSKLPSQYIKIFSIVLISILLVIVGFPIFTSKANSLTAVYVYLSRMATNINGSSATVSIVVAVSPTQNIPTSGSVTLVFPDADDSMWCRTSGSLTVIGEASSIADLTSTNWQIDSALPNNGSALSASCTQGSGSNSSDTLTVSNVGALTGGTTYGFKLDNGSAAGVLGTDDTAGTHTLTVKTQSGATIDSSTFDLYLVSSDSVNVTATVQAVPTVNCSISSNSVSLGTMYPGGAYTTATNSISTSTSSNTTGYYWSAFGTGDGSTDAGLYKSSATTYLIPSTGSGTLDLRNIGSEGFGITVADPDGAGAAVIPSDFSDSTNGVFGALDRTSANTQLILYQNGAQTSADVSTITYGGRASSAAEAGSYSETVYFVCGAYY